MSGREEFMKNLKKIQERKRMRKRTVSIISQKLQGSLKMLKKFNRGESSGEEIAIFFSVFGDTGRKSVENQIFFFFF